MNSPHRGKGQRGKKVPAWSYKEEGVRTQAAPQTGGAGKEPLAGGGGIDSLKV